jgi:hypothetical protein
MKGTSNLRGQRPAPIAAVFRGEVWGRTGWQILDIGGLSRSSLR